MAFFLKSTTKDQSRGSSDSIYSTIVAIGKKVTSDGMPCVSAHCVHFLRLAITKCTALARDSYRHIKTCRWPFPISPLSNHDSGVDRPTQVIVKALAIILHWCWQSMLRPNDDINRHIALQLHVRWKKCICQNDFKLIINVNRHYFIEKPNFEMKWGHVLVRQKNMPNWAKWAVLADISKFLLCLIYDNSKSVWQIHFFHLMHSCNTMCSSLLVGLGRRVMTGGD